MKMPEQYRDVSYRHPIGNVSAPPGSPYGLFMIPSPKKNSKQMLRCLASDGDPSFGEETWEHVSISVPASNRKKKRLPTWEEMCFVKDVFWDEDECVIQYHPPRSRYVNFSECLHLWRPVHTDIPMPSLELV